jgi:glycosyltransferase involved in cell wall biosynthesis
LAQPETVEVILIEDGSPDDSLAVCQELAAAYSIVHLYRHPDGKNHGAGATRNLAILKSTHEYIAFLDADDFFLPGRFSVAKRLFETDPELEGVFEAVDTHFENEAARQRWDELGWGEFTLATMTERVPPEQLFRALVMGGRGGFHLDGLVVKRAVFKKTGLFDEHLRLHQDSAIMLRMAAVAKLVPGRLGEPVAMRRVHGLNRIIAKRTLTEVYKGKLIYWDTLWRWSRQNLDHERQQLVLGRLLRHGMYGSRFNNTFPKWTGVLRKRIQLTLLLFDCPSLIWEGAFWKRLFPSPKYWVRRLRGRPAQKPQL